MTNDTRTPEEIERDIERERAGLTDTLDDLQNKFSVETIARQVSDQFREHGGDIGRSVSDAVKRNPMALALTGVGLAWLMMGDRTGGRDRYDRDDRRDRISREDRYDRTRDAADRYREDRLAGPVGSSGLDTRTTARASSYDDPRSRSYYSSALGTRREMPSWATTAGEDTDPGFGERARNAMSGAGDGVSSAASSATDTARGVGSGISGAAKGATDAVSGAGQSAAQGAQNMAASASERAAALRDSLASGTESLSNEARDRVIAARQAALDARDATLSYTRQGRDKAVDVFEEQPMIAGALALALGAAIGAALPRSDTEDAYLGERSDALMDEAERIFEDEKQKLGKVAQAATDEAKNVFAETRDKAESTAEAAVDAARTSGERVVGAAQSEADKQNVGDVTKSRT